MRLRKIALQHFRNIPFASLEFTGLRQFFVGSNGQGKTNLLEAIGLLTALRSFRGGDLRQLIAHGQTEAAANYSVEHERFSDTSLTLKLKPSGKELSFDQEKVTRFGEFIGRFPVVVFSSQDHQLIRGSPGLRRRFLDLVLAATDPDYLVALQGYHRALADRNRLLRDRAKTDEVAAFEGPLASHAVKLIAKRFEALADFAPRIETFYAKISDRAEPVSLHYAPDETERDPKAFAVFLAANRARDFLLKSTQRGPHRDDFEMLINGRASKDFASEGQQRSLVIALRLAQTAYFQEKLRMKPIVLADDVLGELDPRRRERFWAALDGDLQVFATGTALPEGEKREDWQVFTVSGGAFAPAEVTS